MRNNLFKKSVAFLLSFTMLFAILPLNLAFANLQSHVENLILQYVSSTNGSNYNLNFSWSNPSWSNLADGSYTDVHSPSGFRVEGRNSSLRQTSWTRYLDVSGSDITTANISEELLSGSLFEFRITPYHYHSDTGGSSSTANYDSTTEQESFLFMTDIEVEAVGSGNTLTVTLDNPQYMGQDIFSYKIYYQRGGSDVTNFTSSKTFSVEDSIYTFTDTSRGIQRLTFNITDSSINQGDVYAIKVEPLYDNSELRETGSITYKRILINDTLRKITFKSKNDKEYRVDNVSVSIDLNIQEDGQDYLKLIWSGISNSTGAINRIEIYSGETESDISSLIGTIYSSEAIYINSWRIDSPLKTTYYKILVYIEGIDTPVQSTIAVYIPGVVNITPNRPSLYLYDTVINNQTAINIYWDVFLRYPYTDDEKNLAEADGTYIDTNVTYDLWVSDSISNLNDQNLPKILNSAPASEFTKMTISDTSTPVFNYQALEYVTIDEGGNFVNKDIEENKTYYVKIVVRKPVEGQVDLFSDESIERIYISINTDISNPQALSKPPLKIKENSNGEQEITKNSISIEWRTNWFEIYDAETDNWYTEVAIRDQDLIFGSNILETDTLIQFYDKYNEYFVKQVFSEAGFDEEQIESLVIRQIDLSSSDIKYELQVIEFEDIEISGGYEAYIESILNDESSTNWVTISPSINSYDATYTINDLNENTLYAILLRPYRMVTSLKKEAYPTYILATTLPDEVEIVITPVTPILYEKSHNDTSITVKWSSQGSGILYELAVSEVKLDDPSGSAIKISSDMINENAYSTSEGTSSYINYAINSLFPDTGYYIWVRAVYEGNSSVYSNWSSSVYVKTDALVAPSAPSGFGLASAYSLDYYNSLNNTDYVQADEDYLILEWMRDDNDTYTDARDVSLDNAESLLVNSGVHSYMVMFKNLVANKYYYVRARTKLTIAKSGTSDIQKYYSYIVEASLNSDFKDSITIEVPSINISADKVVSVLSEWTDVYYFRTTFTKDNSEYDGNVNDSLYPLPTEDFEIFYDFVTETLTYRLRSNKVDSSGNADNLVDQRFISNILKNQIYDYSLDLTTHNGYTIKNRVLELPYTIFKAFDERKINLHLTSGNTTFVLSNGFLNTSEVQNLGYNSTVKISIEQMPTSLPTLDYGQTYATTPQKISISVTNDITTKELSYTGSDMSVILKLKNRYLFTDTNTTSYIQTDTTSYWQRLAGDYNTDTGSFTVKSRLLATYSTISVDTTSLLNSSQSQALYEVNSKIYISDIVNSDLGKDISVVQFNNLVSAVANNRTQTTINTALSTDDYNSLKRSNLLMEGSIVSREQGINALVRLYEIKTKRNYENYTTLSTTTFKDISTASSIYQTNLLKAAEIGFFGDETSSRPKNSMTIEEALYMINIILQDSGY